jgi:hypothetical protein
MELLPLREHEEALTADGYQVIGAEILVRHLNNFLLLRLPRSFVLDFAVCPTARPPLIHV